MVWPRTPSSRPHLHTVVATDISPRAGLDMRTGPGLFKKVMWYHRGVGYGNDLTEREPGPWDEEAMQALWQFIQPLIVESGSKDGCAGKT